MKLRTSISRKALLFTAIGGMVGSGWLFGPYFAAKAAGPAAIIAWLLGGMLMLVIALTFAELASSFPAAGGIVRYAELSHGKLTSFTLSWVAWLAAAMVAPIETMAAMQYAADYLPNLAVHVDKTINLTHIGIAVAMALMFIMCIVNYYAVKFFAKSNSIIVSWKLIIPFATILILLIHKFQPSNFFSHGFMPLGWHGILAALPTAGVIFSFIGYSPVIQLAAEAKNPQRTIPFAIIGAIIICILLYCLLEFAYIGALNPEHFSSGWTNLNYKNDAGPIAGIIGAFGIIWFLKILYIDALISPLSTAYIYTTATARMNMAMSHIGFMPQWMQRVNQYSSPWNAILTNFFVGILFFLPFPGWQSMVSFLVSCFVVAYAIGPLSCAALRKSLPQVKRPFKLPFVNFICLSAFYICNLIVYWTGWHVIWKMLLTITLGYLFLLIQQNFREQKINMDIKHGSFIFVYLIGMGVIAYLGSFGGIKLIPFGWDFLVLAIFSIVVFQYAQYAAIKNRDIESLTHINYQLAERKS
ncbi:MAG: APC family permease [Pseudomonadota bacterium]